VTPPHEVVQRPARSRLALLGLPALTLVFHLLTAEGWGIFRDELYYLANGKHLAFGYVDHPPLIGLVAALVQATLGDSIHAIRLVPALAGACVVGVVVEAARTLGGGRFAQLLAGTATMLTPAYGAQFGFLSMNVLDLLVWAVVFLLVARILAGAEPRTWLWVGVACGIGLENKISVLFLGFGLAVGMALTWRRDLLRERWLWIGAGVALLLFLPHVAWQIAEGWPTLEFMENARRGKMDPLPPGAFMLEQVMMMDPLAFPAWFGGLVYLLLSRRFRLLGIAFLAVLLLLIQQGAKAYYVGPAYTVLLAAGGVAWEAWSANRGRLARGALRGTIVLLVVAGGLVSLPMVKPLMSVDDFVRYAAAIGAAPDSGERHEEGRLPQFFADRLGWRELAQTVAGVYDALPPEERAVARVFGQNYGQAGAIDHFGPALGLPPALSGHNSYFLWGPGDWNGEVLIVIGDRRERLLELFESVELGAEFTCADAMPYEARKTIWIARRLRMPVEELWPRVKSYG
jgi:4-amino-4-deoxy-L-arabinose transferase-like glycosyltransferase